MTTTTLKEKIKEAFEKGLKMETTGEKNWEQICNLMGLLTNVVGLETFRYQQHKGESFLSGDCIELYLNFNSCHIESYDHYRFLPIFQISLKGDIWKVKGLDKSEEGVSLEEIILHLVAEDRISKLLYKYKNELDKKRENLRKEQQETQKIKKLIMKIGIVMLVTILVLILMICIF